MARRTIECCKDCPDRYIGCHAKCERYIREKKECSEYWSEYLRKNRLQNEVDNFKINSVYETRRKAHKKK